MKKKILTAIIFTLLFIAIFTSTAFATDGSEADSNAFSELYGYALENADKIFSLLAFIGALILTFAYKKGLFPFVEKALTALSSAVSSLKEETKKSETGVNKFIDELTGKIELSEKYLNDFSSKISELEAKIEKASLLNEKTECFRSVMLAEVEMIYEIFISSSLPQYQKDKVGEAYQKMKEALTEKEA